MEAAHSLTRDPFTFTQGDPGSITHEGPRVVYEGPLRGLANVRGQTRITYPSRSAYAILSTTTTKS